MIIFKKHILFISLFLLALYGFPQQPSKKFKQALKDAEALFEADDFKNAEQKYLSIYQEDPANEQVNLHLAICKYKLKEFPDSILPYLRKVDKSTYAEAQFYEAKLFHLEHKFDEAIVHYKKYKSFPEEKRNVKDVEVNRLIEISKRANDYMSRPHKAIIRNIGNTINTKYPEYVPLISADETVLYFTSRRSGSTGNLNDAWGNYYEDVYVSKNINGDWSAPQNIGPPINTDTHDACVALSADAQQMIIYRTSSDGLSGDLYLTQATEIGWTKPEKLSSHINTEYKELSACFSPDNNSLVFSSDKPGGMGGKDLYRVLRLPNGKWSLPTNLGNTINTEFDEDAPFISADGNTLYFSSKGHETMGEYDIFKCSINEDGTFGAAEDIGYPINTVGDDIFFVVNANAKHGYYSSLNENPAEEGYESEDIYFVDMHYNENDIIVKKGVTLNKNNRLPVHAKITVVDTETHKISGIYNSNSHTGNFIMIVNPYCNYKILAECKDHETIELEMPSVVSQSAQNNDTVLELLFSTSH